MLMNIGYDRLKAIIKDGAPPVNHKINLKPKKTWEGHLFCEYKEVL